MDAVSGKTYLVTGSSGYIGRHLVRWLKELPGARIFGVDQQAETKAETKIENWHPFQGDLLHPDLMKLISEIQPDVVFHTAAAPKTASLEEQLRANVVGTEHLLNALNDAQVISRVVVLGSAAEYGPRSRPVDEKTRLTPTEPYGVVKAAQTRIALIKGRSLGIPVTIGRIFNPYGESSNTLAIAALAAQIARLEEQATKQNRPLLNRIKVKNLLGFRDFIHVDDVAKALIALSQQGEAGRIYNIGSGQAVQLKSVLEQLLTLSTLDAETVDISTRGLQQADFSQAVIDKIQDETGWRPLVSLEEGLKRELDYWREEARALALYTT